MRHIIALAILLTGCSPVERDIEVIASAPSPDSTRIAVVYSDMGGGAAGWCYVCMDVVPGAFNAAGAQCGREHQWFRCSTEIKLNWLSPSELLATYDGRMATEGPPVQSAASSPSVTIRYEVAR